MYSKETKKLILLASPNAPYWQERIDKINRKLVERALGISVNTKLKWEAGEEINTRKLREVFFGERSKPEETLCNRIKKFSQLKEDSRTVEKFVENLYAAFIDKNVSAYDFGEYLGYSIEEVQKTIDEEIYKQYPVFWGIYYENNNFGRKLSRDHFKSFGGLYNLFIEQDNRVLHAMMRVRYPVKIGMKKTMRVKLNIPKYSNIVDDQENYYEFDGFIVVKADSIFWMLEERLRLEASYFQMVTERPDRIEGRNTVTGRYLTTWHGDRDSIGAGRVFFKREDISILTREDRNKFNSEVKVINKTFDEVVKDYEGS